MAGRPDSADYAAILSQGLPLLDVRAPVEFTKGAFPGSVNLPLLDDEQRTAIGTRYKEAGQQAALDLGWSLLTPAVKQARQQQWLRFVEANPDGFLYCFRGGLRSKITQQLIGEAGYHYPRVLGGYKALRQYLLQVVESFSTTTDIIVITGPACSGKTRVLRSMPNAAIDLEALARHRGSAFGGRGQSQPSQIDFENALAVAMLRHGHGGHSLLFLEDEGKLIGRCSLPHNLKQMLRTAPRIELQTPLAERLEIGLQDYVIDILADYRRQLGEQGTDAFAQALRKDLARIRKRLGGERYLRITKILDDAIRQLHQFNRVENFIPAIEYLLTEYYDPMYNYQKQLNSGSTLLQGDFAALKTWAEQNSEYHLTRNKVSVSYDC